jgi:hypothetical protein
MEFVKTSLDDPIGNNEVLDAALRLAAEGTPIFPCSAADKKPLTPHGFEDATTDQEQIREWWEQVPDALIGMPTGERTGVAVFDVDEDKGGYLSAAVLQRVYGRIPDTRRVQTRGGGVHYYFKASGVRNSASVLGPGLDVRGESGYVIVPPSPGYKEVDSAPLADYPAFLDPKKNVLRRGKFDPLAVMGGVKEGRRDTELIRLAGCEVRTSSGRPQSRLCCWPPTTARPSSTRPRL